MQAKIFIIFICIACFVLPVNAQQSCYEFALQSARTEIILSKPNVAIAILEQSLETHPDCIETFHLLADLYLHYNQNAKANNAILQCIKLDSTKGKEILLETSKQMLQFGDVDNYKLLVADTKKITTLPNTALQISETQINRTNKQVTPKANVFGTKPINLGAIINDANMQLSPTLSADATQLIYVSTANKLNEDFMVSNYDTCNGWTAGINLGYPPNTSYPERSGKLSSDGHYLFYTRCDNRSVNGWDGGGCDVMFSARLNDNTWDSPQKFGATINSPDYEADPSISSDNKTMYFVSDRAGGYGGKDIWKSKHEKGLWQKPTNLGPNVNSKGNESAPFIHADKQSLYFTSDKVGGLGGNDFYLARLTQDTAMQHAINLGLPINNKGNQFSITVSTNGQFAIFATDTTTNGKQNFDIYQSQLASAVQPIATHFVIGKIINKKTKLAILDIKINILDSNKKELKVVRSNSGDGSFCIPILHQQKMYLHIDSPDDYNTFEKYIDASNPSVPTIINSHLALKQKNVKDTIYSASFSSENNNDTSLAYCKNNFAIWQQQPNDSIQYCATIYQNKYIDTAFANTVCFSDSGYIQYHRYIDSIANSRQAQFDNYFVWYKKYLQSSGFTEQQLLFDFKQDYWLSKKLYNIDINIVEYYP
jgi:hypothetical protein